MPTRRRVRLNDSPFGDCRVEGAKHNRQDAAPDAATTNKEVPTMKTKATLIATVSLLATAAAAQDNSLTIASWGGSYQ